MAEGGQLVPLVIHHQMSLGGAGLWPPPANCPVEPGQGVQAAE